MRMTATRRIAQDEVRNIVRRKRKEVTSRDRFLDARNRFPSSLEGTPCVFLHLLFIHFASYTYYTLASSDAFSSFERTAGMLPELEILDESTIFGIDESRAGSILFGAWRGIER